MACKTALLIVVAAAVERVEVLVRKISQAAYGPTLSYRQTLVPKALATFAPDHSPLAHIMRRWCS